MPTKDSATVVGFRWRPELGSVGVAFARHGQRAEPARHIISTRLDRHDLRHRAYALLPGDAAPNAVTAWTRDLVTHFETSTERCFMRPSRSTSSALAWYQPRVHKSTACSTGPRHLAYGLDDRFGRIHHRGSAGGLSYCWLATLSGAIGAPVVDRHERPRHTREVIRSAKFGCAQRILLSRGISRRRGPAGSPPRAARWRSHR